MKIKQTGLLALSLAAALTLSACSTTAQDAGTTQTLSSKSSQAQTEASATDPAKKGSAATGGSDTTATQTESQFDVTDAFSKRDLSGEYDAAEAVPITLNGSAISASGEGVTVSGTTATITAAGTYILSGTLDNGAIIVDVSKEDKVQLVLNGVTISSADFAPIYVRQADKVFITLAEGTVNTFSNGGTFTAIDDNNVDAVIYSKDDLTLNGTGALKITASGKHGIVSKDDLVIASGTYEITASSHTLAGKDSVSIADGVFTLTAGKDGIHAENDEDETLGNLYIAGGTFTIRAGDDAVHANTLLQIDGGTFDITAAEGMEGTYLRINDGTISIQAADDGINAARKSSAYPPTVEINGGSITIVMGQGDTDGVDSNGNLIITGGTVSVTGNSTFDVDGTVTFTGGTVLVNGEQVTSIPTQMMGGRGGMMGGKGGMTGTGSGAFPRKNQGAADSTDGASGATAPGGRGTQGTAPARGDGTMTVRGGKSDRRGSATEKSGESSISVPGDSTSEITGV